MNTNVLRNLSYGVYVVSSMDGERPVGCTANSIMQITSDPATVAASINHDNYTNGCIKKTGRFSVAILSEECDPSLIGHFGFQSSKDVNKYDTVPYDMIEGVPVPKDCCGYIVCEIVDSMETSSHTVFLGHIIEGDVRGKASPMTYAYYHNVVKGKSPKNAPTYIPDEKEDGSSKWVCSVCGYEYDGDIPFEELPDDWKCPICGVSKDRFEKK